MISNQKKNPWGFTLIELMLVIFILTIGISGAVAMFSSGIRLGRLSQMSTVAVNLAQGKMEELISKPYSEIGTGEVSENYGTIANFPFYKRKTTISCFDPDINLSPNCPETGIKKIEIIVYWKLPYGISENNIRVINLIARK